MTNLVIAKQGRSNVYAVPEEGGFRIGRGKPIWAPVFYRSLDKSTARRYRKACHALGLVGLASAPRK